jgi:hypothetical protein
MCARRLPMLYRSQLVHPANMYLPRDNTTLFGGIELQRRVAYDVVENIGPRLTVTAVTLMSIAVVLVMLKTYTRVVLLRFMGSDDWCTLAATVRIPSGKLEGKYDR